MRGRGVECGLTPDNGGNSEGGDSRNIVSRRVKKKKEQKSRGDTLTEERRGGSVKYLRMSRKKSRKILHSKLAATA